MAKNKRSRPKLWPLTIKYQVDDGRPVFPETNMQATAGLKISISLPGTVYSMKVKPYRAEVYSVRQRAKTELIVNENVQLLIVKVPHGPSVVTVYYH